MNCQDPFSEHLTLLLLSPHILLIITHFIPLLYCFPHFIASYSVTTALHLTLPLLLLSSIWNVFFLFFFFSSLPSFYCTFQLSNVFLCPCIFRNFSFSLFVLILVHLCFACPCPVLPLFSSWLYISFSLQSSSFSSLMPSCQRSASI